MKPKRRQDAARWLVVACAASFVTSEAKSESANSLRDLYGAINQCMKAPAGLPGDEITLLFSLKRDGSLLGKPRISHANLHGDANDQAKFLGSVLTAFAKCLPLKISDGLGGAIAGRPMTFRIVTRPREFISDRFLSRLSSLSERWKPVFWNIAS